MPLKSLGSSREVMMLWDNGFGEDIYRVLGWTKSGNVSVEGQIRVGEVIKYDLGNCFPVY